MIAPMANIRNDEPAATQGDGFSLRVDAELLDQMEVQRAVLVAVDLVGGLGRGLRRHAHVDEHRDQLGPLGLRMLAEGARSTRTSESICSLAVVTDVYSPSAIENAPASSPATPLSTTACALGAGGHTRDQRGVADQAVHRAERRGAQPAAGDVGVAVIDLCGSPSASTAASRTRSWRRFNATGFGAG